MQVKGGKRIMKYRSKRIINILLIVCILVANFIGSVYATKHMFSDSIGHWAEETINILTERGIIQGYPDGLSYPDNIITRGEFSALLARTMKLVIRQRDRNTVLLQLHRGTWDQLIFTQSGKKLLCREGSLRHLQSGFHEERLEVKEPIQKGLAMPRTL